METLKLTENEKRVIINEIEAACESVPSWRDKLNKLEAVANDIINHGDDEQLLNFHDDLQRLLWDMLRLPIRS